jgi:hypothetical protein
MKYGVCHKVVNGQKGPAACSMALLLSRIQKPGGTLLKQVFCLIEGRSSQRSRGATMETISL